MKIHIPSLWPLPPRGVPSPWMGEGADEGEL